MSNEQSTDPELKEVLLEAMDSYLESFITWVSVTPEKILEEPKDLIANFRKYRNNE